MNIIEINSISKKYINGVNYLEILKDCSYNLLSGKFYSIIGRSGLGKSTLLRIIGTVEKPDSGEIFFNGQNLSKMNDKELTLIRKNKIGFVFQNFCLIDRYSVEDNLELPLFFAGIKDKTVRNKRIRETLDLLQIPVNKLTQTTSLLSGGEKQRIAIGRALINSPPLILADEPTGSLDSDNEEKIMNVFESIKKELNKTIIMVTHNKNLADRTDEILTIENKKIVKAGGVR